MHSTVLFSCLRHQRPPSPLGEGVLSECNKFDNCRMRSAVATNKFILRVMKITAFLLFAACLHVAARTDGQSITLSVKNKPLEKVLSEIKKQSGFSFIYGKELINKAGPVSIDVKDEPLVKVL